jgi:hypothetical protein
MSTRLGAFALALPLSLLVAQAAQATPSDAGAPAISAEREHMASGTPGCAGCNGADCANCPLMRAAALQQGEAGSVKEATPCSSQ